MIALGEVDDSNIRTNDQYLGGNAVSHLITGISSIEVPVSDLKKSVDWYTRILGLEVQYEDATTAMLTFNAIGVPGVYLCQTEASDRLQFVNTNTNITHSIIDFYTADLQQFYDFLIEQQVEVGKLNVHGDFGGFGFRDPDGNLLSACNILQKGQA